MSNRAQIAAIMQQLTKVGGSRALTLPGFAASNVRCYVSQIAKGYIGFKFSVKAIEDYFVITVWDDWSAYPDWVPTAMRLALSGKPDEAIQLIRDNAPASPLADSEDII